LVGCDIELLTRGFVQDKMTASGHRTNPLSRVLPEIDLKRFNFARNPIQTVLENLGFAASK
jgi:hypothetical protein